MSDSDKSMSPPAWWMLVALVAAWRYWGLKFSVGPVLVVLSTLVTRGLLDSMELMLLGWYLSVSSSWMFNAWMRQRYQPRRGPGPGRKRQPIQRRQMPVATAVVMGLLWWMPVFWTLLDGDEPTLSIKLIVSVCILGSVPFSWWMDRHTVLVSWQQWQEGRAAAKREAEVNG